MIRSASHKTNIKYITLTALCTKQYRKISICRGPRRNPFEIHTKKCSSSPVAIAAIAAIAAATVAAAIAAIAATIAAAAIAAAASALALGR